MEIVPLFGETTSDTDSVSTTEQPTSTIPIVPESPFHQKQLHLLTNAFKGSVNHRISSTGRKPSVLKLSKRTDSAESSLLLAASPHVKFAPNEFADGSHENENEAQLRRGRFASMAARRSILKRSEYSEQIVSAKPFAAPPNITPTAAINTDDMTPEQLQASTREQQLEQQRVELLQSIHFHHHRDKSKSHIDVKVLAERQWLDEYPQSQRWKEIENKVSTSQSEQGREMMDQENELAERFIDTAILQGAAHINNLLSGADNDKERLVVRLTFALLNDVISDMIRETCADMLKQSAQAWAVLNKSLVKSLASVSLGLEGSSSRFWKMSGREHILKGALLDAQRALNHPNSTSTTAVGGRGCGSSCSRGDYSLHTAQTLVSLTEKLSTAPGGAGRLAGLFTRNGGGAGGADRGGADINSSAGKKDGAYSAHYDSVVHIPDALLSVTNEDITQNTEASSAGAEDKEFSVEHDEAHNYVHSATKVPGEMTHITSNTSTSSKPVDPVALLYDIEVAFWADVSCTTVINAPLQIPSALSATNSGNSYFTRVGSATSLGVVSCVQLLTLPSTHYASLLLCGLSNGRVVCYSVRWTGDESALIGASALPEKTQQSPIVEVKSSSLGSNVFLSRAQNGIISVHQLNSALSLDTDTSLAPITRAKKSWFPFLFGSKQKKTDIQNIVTLFRIDSSDLIFALPSLQDTIKASINDTHDADTAATADSAATAPVANNKNSSIFRTRDKSSTDKNGSTNNSGAFPSAVCFFPSLTLLGSNTSIAVGTVSGDVVKFNMDYIHGTASASVTFPCPPFVNKEFIHPHNAPKGFVLTSGVSEKPGNKVFRELFHYHKAKILLLEVVNRVSPFIVSVDQGGLIALWKYDVQCFEGKCWFRPYKTSRLALQCTELIPTGRYLPAVSPEDSTKSETAAAAAADGEEVDMSAAGAAQPSVEVPVSSTSNGDEGFVGDTGVSAVGGDGDPAAGGSGSANLKDHQHSGLLIHHDPTEDEEVSSQLKVREVFNNRETGRVVKSYFPVYSESRQLWLQYRSVEYKVPVDGSNKGPESPANRLRVKKKTAAAGPASPTKAANTDKTTPSPVSEAGAGDTSMGTETTAGAEGTSAEGAPTTEISSTIALPADNTTTATTTTAAATADASTGAFPAVSEPNPTTGDGGADNEQRTDSSKGELPDSTSPVEVVMDLSTSDIAALTQAPADAEANKTPFTVSISAGGGGGDGGDGDGEGNEDAVEQVQLEDDADVPQEEPTAMSAGGDTLPSRAQPSVASPVLTSATPGDNGDAPTATEAATGPADDATVGAPVASLSPHSARSETSAEGSESSLRQPILQMETVEAASAALAMSTPSRSPSSIPAESNKQEHLTVEEKEEENKEENEEEEMPETVFTRLAELLTAHRAGMLGGFINHHPAAESLSAESESSAAAPLLEPLSDGAADEKSLPTADDHRPALSLSPSQQFLQIGEPSVTSEDATTTVPAATATSSIAAIGATNSGTGVPMKKVAEWSAAEILVEKELNFTIVSAKMSFDGTEVVMLLAARVNTKETAEGGEKGEVYPQTTVYYIVSYLPLEQRFHNPFPKLFLPSDRDAVLDFCVGPVAFETLTRTAFVLTKQSLRLFSMHTGRELITNNFPFVWELGSFAPNLVTVCPSQRVVTLAATDDARIAVFLLQHTRDGSSHITSLQEERDLEKRRKLSAKVRAAVPGATMQEEAHVYSVQPHEAAVRTVLNIVVESSPEHFAIQTDAQDIVEALVAHVMKNIDIRAERDRKAGLIAEVYEGKMGFIEPMVWPPMITEVLPLRLTSDSPVEGEGGGENGMQGESPRGGKGRKSKNGRKKNKKERMKGVAQQGANAQNSEEVTAETYSVVHSDAAEPL